MFKGTKARNILPYICYLNAQVTKVTAAEVNSLVNLRFALYALIKFSFNVLTCPCVGPEDSRSGASSVRPGVNPPIREEELVSAAPDRESAAR